MSKKTISSKPSNVVKPVFTVDPTECPFREYRDNELQPEFWGMGPSCFRAYSNMAKGVGYPKPPPDYVWADEQTQPLPRSVRQYLNGYVRAEDLARNRWEADVVVSEEINGEKMSLADIQLSHAQVLTRSSFCRSVLSACFMLERADNYTIEHQWEGFSSVPGPEGWRAKYHIYSPGIKPGGGAQHRPTLSKNGCYMVRLFYLGAWRCVWVSDQVPVDATEAPLLPFSPLLSKVPPTKPGTKPVPTTVTSNVVYLWPLLICKALLKLAAPDMSSDESSECVDDEIMAQFDIMHCLTGAMSLNYNLSDSDLLWELITSEVPVFSWDDDEDTQASTVKSKSTRKPTNKDVPAVKKSSIMYVVLHETKHLPPYHLPGITPGFEMTLLISMARDLPLKKPLPEPEIALWKTFRWVDWARNHGLYSAYECPRTRFLKVNGLLKLSFAPHLLDVQSTESITVGFVKAEIVTHRDKQASKPRDTKTVTTPLTNNQISQIKEEFREWILYEPLQNLIKTSYVLYSPSTFEYTSAVSTPPVRVTKGTLAKHLDIVAPKTAPLYLQIDGPDVNKLRISMNVLHPRVLANSGVLIEDYIEGSYLFLESFEWFKDSDLPKPKAFIRTRGYGGVEVTFPPGRHVCRIWVHSRMNWHMMLLSESSLLLGTRDHIQCAAVRDCPWASKYLTNLSNAFINWIKIHRSNIYLPSVQSADREFFRSYHPDLPWDKEVVGYDRSQLHWMFRQALQSHLFKRLLPTELSGVFTLLRKCFCDPDFGFKEKPVPTFCLKTVAASDPCDCQIARHGDTELVEEEIEEIEEVSFLLSREPRRCQVLIHTRWPNAGWSIRQTLRISARQGVEEKVVIPNAVMDKILKPPVPPVTSNICEMATEDIPCGVLKEERSKAIDKHLAATLLQAHWRGTWVRKCLQVNVNVTPEVLKILQDSIFGNHETLSALMNEFFILYPGTKYAYSVASALSGVLGLHQHHGVSTVSRTCKWIPYFQGVFYCHANCKVHFDVNSTLPHSTVKVYNNDTGMKLPQAYNAHKTFDVEPNIHGYTVMGHGSLKEPPGIGFEVHWQLTILSSTEGAFHICDNEEYCKELPLSSASKLHIDEIFIPNRRNILGGIQLSVTRHEAISFRAAATSPDLEIVAKLRTTSSDGKVVELSSCSGVGELFWPYIRLVPLAGGEHSNIKLGQSLSSAISSRSTSRPNKNKPPTTGKNIKSATKLKSYREPKQYSIEVVAPSGWPLTLAQWKRVDEARNLHETIKIDNSKKAALKEKTPTSKASARERSEKEKVISNSVIQIYPINPGDAYVELECSLTSGRGIVAQRDDDREMEFTAARKAWDQNEPGRNRRGAEIRKEFREEFLETPAPPASDTTVEPMMNDFEGEHNVEEYNMKEEHPVQGPTPVSDSGMLETSLASEEEAKYLLMPDQLRDKFKPLHFVPMCTKELLEDGCTVLSPGMAEAGIIERQARKHAAIARKNELQAYNENVVLGLQKKRSLLLGKLFVDSILPPEISQVLEERIEAIAQETMARTLSAAKKKQDSKPSKK